MLRVFKCSLKMSDIFKQKIKSSHRITLHIKYLILVFDPFCDTDRETDKFLLIFGNQYSRLGVTCSGIFLIISGYLDSSQATIAAQCAGVFFFGFAFSAVMVNALDVGQRHGGIIIGISNAIATTPGFIGPAIVGIVTKNGVNLFLIPVFSTQISKYVNLLFF